MFRVPFLLVVVFFGYALCVPIRKHAECMPYYFAVVCAYYFCVFSWVCVCAYLPSAHDKTVNAMHSTGDFMVTGSKDGTVKVWGKGADMSLISQFDLNSASPKPYNLSVRSVKLLTDKLRCVGGVDVRARMHACVCLDIAAIPSILRALFCRIYYEHSACKQGQSSPTPMPSCISIPACLWLCALTTRVCICVGALHVCTGLSFLWVPSPRTCTK